MRHVSVANIVDNFEIKRFGELLIEKRLLSHSDLDRALHIQSEIGGKIGSILVRIGAASEEQVIGALSEQLDIPVVGQAIEFPSAEQIVSCCRELNIDIDWLVDQQALIWLSDDKKNLVYASKDPLCEPLISALEIQSGGRLLQPCLLLSQNLDTALRGIISVKDHRGSDSEEYLKELAEDAPTIELVNNLFAQAIDAGASDIHFEPEERVFNVRFRLDGILTTKLSMGRERFDAVASRVKLISGMDIAERRLPQDGSISTRAGGADVDIRVSALPGVFGESMVMRLLPKNQDMLKLSSLGMLDDHMAMMNQLVRRPHGIILVTGPTGSGKSTTLYTALDETNDRNKKIITVENPVEFKLQNITQIQTNEEIGLSFAECLRSILRQDPDVIMIGEIRDLETAEIAMQSALTGHLVLSTLHTNNSLSSFARLIDMGVEPFMVATPIIAVQAQRLLRKVCSNCCEVATSISQDADEILKLAREVGIVAKVEWKKALGCEDCQNTGYKGRLGVYEVVAVTPEMQALILKQAPLAEMYALAKGQGYRTLYEDGMLKAMMGLTSVEEVYRVCRDNHGYDL